jgi:hypothetical protein
MFSAGGKPGEKELYTCFPDVALQNRADADQFYGEVEIAPD